MFPKVVGLDSEILTSGISISVKAFSTFFSTELTSAIGWLTKRRFLFSAEWPKDFLVFYLEILLGEGTSSVAIYT